MVLGSGDRGKAVHVELGRLVDDVIEACGECERILHLPTNHICVHADPVQLAYAIVTLLYVATAGPPIGSTLQVRTIRNGAHARVIVTVNACACSDGKALDNVREIATRFGGSLDVVVGPGMTRYCLELPAFIGTDSEISVLLVDDSIEQLTALAELLRVDGLAIQIATSGADALARVQRRAPDVLVSDVELADMTGIEVIRRARHERPHMRTVLMSGYPITHPRIAGVLSEVSAYFSKPVDIDELLEVVASSGSAER